MTPEEELAKARERVERRWKPYPTIGDRAFAPTGEEYIIMFSGEWVWPTASAAVIEWMRCIDAYGAAQPKGAALYWRIPPEITEWKGLLRGKVRAPSGWKVYSRLLISDKPVIAAPPNRLLSDQWRDHVNAVTIEGDTK